MQESFSNGNPRIDFRKASKYEAHWGLLSIWRARIWQAQNLHMLFALINEEDLDKSSPATSENFTLSANFTKSAQNINVPLILRLILGVSVGVGVITNAFACTLFATVIEKRKNTILFLHQSVLDLLICFLRGVTILYGKPSSKDPFTCLVWESEVLFWSYVFLSVLNLMYISLERQVHEFKVHNNSERSDA